MRMPKSFANGWKSTALFCKENKGCPRMPEMELGHWISLGTAVAALIAFIVGLAQYRHAQRWKRAEFVAKEIKELKSDPAIRNALLMLDWNERYIELFPG